MIIKILVEDDNEIKEHGLSLMIEYDDKKILFDVGQSDLFLRNGKKMGVDFTTLDLVVLSHGHYDHGNGLMYLRDLTLLCHPEVFLKRYRPDGSYVGLNLTKEEINKRFNLMTSKEPYFITNDICFLGEIMPKLTKYHLSDGTKDYIPDDSALVFNTKKGLVIITGCSHSGIENIMLKAKEVFKENKIFALIGGFHLKEIDKSLDDVINAMKNIDQIYTGHCTSSKVIQYFNKSGLNAKKMKSLMRMEL